MQRAGLGGRGNDWNGMMDVAPGRLRGCDRGRRRVVGSVELGDASQRRAEGMEGIFRLGEWAGTEGRKRETGVEGFAVGVWCSNA